MAKERSQPMGHPSQQKSRSHAAPRDARDLLDADGDAEAGSLDQAKLGQQGIGAAHQGRFMLGPLEPLPENPLEKAQCIMEEAWQASGRRRITLARKALTYSKDCADAYVLLASEAAKSIGESLELLQLGVAAGERAIGPERFASWKGRFWLHDTARPYMNARAGLAGCLWAMGRHQEALDHYADLLRLNRSDNQGMRYVLASCLLELNRDDELGELLDRYPRDPWAAWTYTRALWSFRRQGANRVSNQALRKALQSNRYVPLYLLGLLELPKEAPAGETLGGEDEAISYVSENAAAWMVTPGAVEWLLGEMLKRAEKALRKF